MSLSRRYLVTLVLLSLIGSSLPATALGRISSIEVGIAVNVESAHIRTEGDAECSGAAEIRRLDAGEELTVRLTRGRVLLLPSRAPDQLTVYEVADTFRLRPEKASDLVVVDGKRYRGGLKIFRSPSAKIHVVNVVGIEDYLRGVLPHEIGKLSQQTLEAGKAQAVAARTYALSYIGRRYEEGFDVFATVEDQLYGGVGDEGKLTDRCVFETQSVVGLYEGNYIRANYSSTCGGITSNIEDVWPEPPLPWLKSIPDHASDGSEDFCKISGQYRWTDIWEIQEFLDIVNENYPTVVGTPPGKASRLDDVTIAARSPSGRVARLVIETDVGPLTVGGDNVRWLLRRPKRSRGVGGAGGILRSALFKISLARDARGNPYAVVASGAGYGHGVGMCQMGAIGMAKNGYDYRAILEHYYRDVNVTRVKALAEASQDTRGY